MVWDPTSPAGSDFISLGDDNLRELKTDLQGSLRGQTTEGIEAIFPGSDASNPVFRYRGLKGTTAARPTSGDYGLYINTTLNSLQRDNGSSWEDVATLIPSGTVMVFFQATAPTGWTKVTTQNDKALRVVSGTGGGSGGTNAMSAGLSHSHTVNSHTHDLANHTHAGGAHTHTVPRDGWGGGTTGSERLLVNDGFGAPVAANVIIAGNDNTTGSSGTGNTGTPSNNTSGAASPGTDSQAPTLQYIDVIVCSKD